MAAVQEVALQVNLATRLDVEIAVRPTGSARRDLASSFDAKGGAYVVAQVEAAVFTGAAGFCVVEIRFAPVVGIAIAVRPTVDTAQDASSRITEAVAAVVLVEAALIAGSTVVGASLEVDAFSVAVRSTMGTRTNAIRALEVVRTRISAASAMSGVGLRIDALPTTDDALAIQARFLTLPADAGLRIATSGSATSTVRRIVEQMDALSSTKLEFFVARRAAATLTAGLSFRASLAALSAMEWVGRKVDAFRGTWEQATFARALSIEIAIARMRAGSEGEDAGKGSESNETHSYLQGLGRGAFLPLLESSPRLEGKTILKMEHREKESRT